jgi:hypothetical protein
VNTKGSDTLAASEAEITETYYSAAVPRDDTGILVWKLLTASQVKVLC